MEKEEKDGVAWREEERESVREGEEKMAGRTMEEGRDQMQKAGRKKQVQIRCLL